MRQQFPPKNEPTHHRRGREESYAGGHRAGAGCGHRYDASTGGFLGLVGGQRAKALRVESVAGNLFASGWDDLSIRVFQAERFDRAMSLGEEYEQLTQQAVTLIYYF